MTSGLETKPNSITISKYKFPVSLRPAVVIHANKFSEAHGGAFDFPVQSTLYTDVVFETEDSHHIRARLTDLDLPLYNQQKVALLTTGNVVLAFADLTTNLFYFASKDPGGRLGVRMKFNRVWIIALAAGLLLFSFIKYFSFWLFAPLAIMLLIYHVQKFIINRRINFQIKSFMSE